MIFIPFSIEMKISDFSDEISDDFGIELLDFGPMIGT